MSKIDSSNDIIPEEIRNVNVALLKGQKLNITDKVYIDKPPFILVAHCNRGVQLNYTKELLAMTPQEGFVFDILMDNRLAPFSKKQWIRSNYSSIDNSILTASEKKKVYEGYKRLRAKNLVVRVSRGKYLINPELVITSDDLYEQELAEYKMFD